MIWLWQKQPYPTKTTPTSGFSMITPHPSTWYLRHEKDKQDPKNGEKREKNSHFFFKRAFKDYKILFVFFLFFQGLRQTCSCFFTHCPLIIQTPNKRPLFLTYNICTTPYISSSCLSVYLHWTNFIVAFITSLITGLKIIAWGFLFDGLNNTLDWEKDLGSDCNLIILKYPSLPP